MRLSLFLLAFFRSLFLSILIYLNSNSEIRSTVSAIANYTQRVADTSLPFEQRQQALMFLDHVRLVSFYPRFDD